MYDNTIVKLSQMYFANNRKGIIVLVIVHLHSLLNNILHNKYSEIIDKFYSFPLVNSLPSKSILWLYHGGILTGGHISIRALLMTSPRGTANKKLKYIDLFGDAN